MPFFIVVNLQIEVHKIYVVRLGGIQSTSTGEEGDNFIDDLQNILQACIDFTQR